MSGDVAEARVTLALARGLADRPTDVVVRINAPPTGAPPPDAAGLSPDVPPPDATGADNTPLENSTQTGVAAADAVFSATIEDDLSDAARRGALHALQTRFAGNLVALNDTLQLYCEELEGNDESDHSINDSRDEWHTIEKVRATFARIVETSHGHAWMSDDGQRRDVEQELLELEDHCAELPSFLHHRLHSMVAEVRTQYRTLIALNSITTVSGAVLFGVFLRLMYTWVFRPLRLLVKGSRCVAAGDFSYRIRLRSQRRNG